MNSAVKQAFERNLSEYDFDRKRVLEVGVGSNQELLTSLPTFQLATETVLVDLSLPEDVHDGLEADVNRLPIESNSFDCVLINAVFEHNPSFWEGLAETKRVTREGGVIGIGVPGYSPLHRNPSWLERLGLREIAIDMDTSGTTDDSANPASGGRPWYQRLYDLLPTSERQKIRRLYQKLVSLDKDATTPVLGTHGAPNDYYRFSENTVGKVFFSGCSDVTVEEVLNPPRFVGVGVV